MSECIFYLGSASSRGERVIDGSRFIGAVTGILHAHQRRASAQNVDGCIRVGMGSETTVATSVAGLALSARFIDGSARRAFLRREGGIDLNERPATLFKFIGKQRFHRSPALFVDAPAQAATNPNHVLGLQRLDRDNTKAPRNVCRGLVPPVTANARNPGRQSCETKALLAIAVRSPLPACEDALRAPLKPLQSFGGRRGKQLASGQRERVGNTPINPHGGEFGWSGLMLDLAVERDVPFAASSGDGHVEQVAGERARVAVFDPSEVRNADHAPASVCLLRANVPTLTSEAVIASALAGLWIVCSTGEERGECPVEIAQRLSERHCGNGGKPRDFATQLRDLMALADVVQRSARCGSILPPEEASLFERQIIDEARCADELREAFGLLGCWVEPVAKATLNHDLFLARINGARQENERAQPLPSSDKERE